jgi:hypothetical protein
MARDSSPWMHNPATAVEVGGGVALVVAVHHAAMMLSDSK